MTARWAFGLTLFVAAALSFAIEPMAAKALQPALGGVASVWTTCLLFFQLALLAGYAAQFALSRAHFERTRLVAHGALLAAPFALARFDLVERARTLDHFTSPVLATLGFLATTVGLPFVALSTVAPALQRYFARATGQEPYRLYAASNAGSTAGLLAYPLLIEPFVALSSQGVALRAAYAVVATAVLSLGAWSLKNAANPRAEIQAQHDPTSDRADESAPRERSTTLAWLVSAAVPSALLATTSASIASDLPGVPLLWVAPLATYLLTFVAAFRRGKLAPDWVVRALAIVSLVLLPISARRLSSPFALVLALNLALLALASFAFHCKLAASAPGARSLERFYLVIAVGGALGTLVFGIAPTLLLPDLWELPLAIALSALATRDRTDSESTIRDDAVRAIAPAAWVLVVVALVRAKGITVDAKIVAAAYGPAILLATRATTRTRVFTAAMVLFALAASVFESSSGTTLVRTRSYFGALRVASEQRGAFTVLVHGTTIHGIERRAQRGQCEPRAYYFRDGPLGRAIAARRRAFETRSVLAIGLGAGSIVCFARPAERWTFVEIDPEIVRIARDPRWFTFLSSNPLRREPELVVGDGRLALREQPQRSRSLVVVDAFNSDSVPLHLLTRESLALALRALEPDGWVLLHVSNHALDLPRAVAALVADARVAARINADANGLTGRGNKPTWVVIARDERSLAPLDSQWIRLPDPRGLRAFTDERASIVPIIQWR
ncbi:MAG: fused MFS/spermidine synthase [Myxococcales bacterium]|nr:fused MFS/spermidine synthase [Myxococcales bacterium]